MDVEQEQHNNKNKVMQWSYTVLMWALPFLYLTLCPWILNYARFLARDEITFGPDASMSYHNLSVFILPILINLVLGAGAFILVFGIKKFKSKAILAGNLLGLCYALLILLSYPIYFNINFVFSISQQLIDQIFSLGMYTGPGQPSFILAFYGLLLYQIIKSYRGRMEPNQLTVNPDNASK